MDTMRAAVIYEAGPPDALKLVKRPIPKPKSGEVLIRVKAFGLNRSELFTRRGYSPDVTFPRILGIEAVGLIEEAPAGEFRRGDTVMTAMGGLGRKFNGSYADYTVVPAKQVQGHEHRHAGLTVFIPRRPETARLPHDLPDDLRPGAGGNAAFQGGSRAAVEQGRKDYREDRPSDLLSGCSKALIRGSFRISNILSKIKPHKFCENEHLWQSPRERRPVASELRLCPRSAAQSAASAWCCRRAYRAIRAQCRAARWMGTDSAERRPLHHE